MGRKRAQLDVSLKLLLDSGEIESGHEVLQVASREETRYGDLHPDGSIVFEGIKHRSLSSFAVAAIRSCGAVSRRTANGWQAVSFRGRALDQYRTDFLEKRSHVSDSTSRDVNEANDKKRRVAADGVMKLRESWRESSADSGSSRCSFTEISPTNVRRKIEGSSTGNHHHHHHHRRIRPSRSWFDALPASSVNNKTAKTPTIDVSCGMNVNNDCEKRTEEEEAEQQDLKVNMWIKKALNKRHREESGMA
eukprot:g4611.t1